MNSSSCVCHCIEIPADWCSLATTAHVSWFVWGDCWSGLESIWEPANPIPRTSYPVWLSVLALYSLCMFAPKCPPP